MKNNYERIDEFNANHKGENGESTVATNFQETIKLQQKYLEKSIRQLQQYAKRQVNERKSIIKEVYELVRAEERFKRQGFYNRKYVYLVSKKWLQEWKKYSNYEEIVRYQNLELSLNHVPAKLDRMNIQLIDRIFNPTITFTEQSKLSHFNIALNPAIKQNSHFEYFSQQMWNILKHYQHEEIKRYIVETKVNEKKESLVEVFLQKFTIVLLTSKTIKDIRNKKMETFQYEMMQFSKFSSGAYFKYESSQFILETLNRDSFNQISFWNANINFWIIDPTWDMSKLFSRVKKSVDYQQDNKSFTLCLYGVELMDGKTLEEQIHSDQTILVCQILVMNQKPLCYSLKKSIKSDCPNCSKQQIQLKVHCKCKYIAYCSEECQKADAKHKKKCPYLAKQALKIKQPEVKRNGLVGLTNLGNTCFMNSGIQCLSNISQLAEYFITNEYIKDINTVNPLGTKGNLSNAYAEMMKNLWCENIRTYSPHLFKRSVSAFQRMFSGYDQHDSGQFLTYLLDGLHEDLNRIKKKPYIESKDEDERPDKTIAREQWKNFKLRNDSKIVQLMYGQFRSQVDCPKCKYRSIQFDPFLICSLPIPNSHAQANNQPFLTHKIMISFLKQNSKEQTVNCSYEHGQKMEKIVQYLRQKFQISEKAKLIIYSSKLIINQNQNIIEVKSRFKQKICARILSQKQNLSGCKIFVYLREQKLKNNQNIIQNSVQKLYCFNPQTSLSQIHQLISRSQLHLLSAYNLSYEDMIKSKAFKERPIKISVKQQMINFCWNCKMRCQGCQFPYSKMKIGQLFDSIKKSSISLNLTIKRAQSNQHWKKENQNMNGKISNTSKAQTQLSILDCFKAFQQPEILTKDNAWYCSKCKNRVQAKKQMMIFKCPKILIICLKRFKKKMYSTDKNYNFVDFPITNLDLSQIVLSSKLPQTNTCSQNQQNCNQRVLYDLFAVSHHMGDANSGHYTATCLNPYNKLWYHFDDERVNQVEESKIVSKSAYILFYRRKEK